MYALCWTHLPWSKRRQLVTSSIKETSPDTSWINTFGHVEPPRLPLLGWTVPVCEVCYHAGDERSVARHPKLNNKVCKKSNESHDTSKEGPDACSISVGLQDVRGRDAQLRAAHSKLEIEILKHDTSHNIRVQPRLKQKQSKWDAWQVSKP